jgi:hypothetical protein
VVEERRGKWSFYSLDREAVRMLLGETAEHLDAITWARDVVTAKEGS